MATNSDPLEADSLGGDSQSERYVLEGRKVTVDTSFLGERFFFARPRLGIKGPSLSHGPPNQRQLAMERYSHQCDNGFVAMPWPFPLPSSVKGIGGGLHLQNSFL